MQVATVARDTAKNIATIYQKYSDIALQWSGDMSEDTFHRIDGIFAHWSPKEVQRLLSTALATAPAMLAGYAHALRMPLQPDKYTFLLHLYDLNELLYQIKKSLPAVGYAGRRKRMPVPAA